MRAEFAKSGIHASFSDACLVPLTNVDEFLQSEGVTLGAFGKRLTRGEVGCYISHRRLWKALLQSDFDAFVIMEDDMRLLPGFRETVESVMRLGGSVDLVRLGPLRPHERSYSYRALCGGRSVYWTKRTALGMGCYSITREAAIAFLEATKTFKGPIDYDVDRCWSHGKKVQMVYPVVAEIMDLQSTIDGRVDDRDRHIGFRERWDRRLSKHLYRLTVTLQRLRNK